MHLPSWLTIGPVAAVAAAVLPLEANAADIQTVTGVPRVSLGDIGVHLVRQVAVAIDDPGFALDVSALLCAQASTIAASPIRTGDPSCPPASLQWLGQQAISGTLKLPQWTRDVPLIDLAFRAWRSQTNSDGAPAHSRGAATDVEITQPIGRYAIIAGYSHPLRIGSDDRWRVAWTGASFSSPTGTRLQFVHEWSRDERSAARDSRYTMSLGQPLGKSVRADAYITLAPNDIDRHWRAGVGIDWSF